MNALLRCLFFFFFFYAESGGFEEGLCGRDFEHGEGGCSEGNGVGTEGPSVPARARIDERRGNSHVAEIEADARCKGFTLKLHSRVAIMLILMFLFWNSFDLENGRRYDW